METCSFPLLVHSLLIKQTASHTLAHRLQPTHHSSLVLGLGSPEAVDLGSGEEYLSCCCVFCSEDGLAFCSHPQSGALRTHSCPYRALDLFSARDPGYSFGSLLTFDCIHANLCSCCSFPSSSIPACVSCLSAYTGLTFYWAVMQSLWALGNPVNRYSSVWVLS